MERTKEEQKAFSIDLSIFLLAALIGLFIVVSAAMKGCERETNAYLKCVEKSKVPEECDYH